MYCPSTPPGSTDCCLQTMSVLEEEAALLPPSTPCPSFSFFPPPSTSVIHGSQNQAGIMYRVQDGFTRFIEKCESTWKSLICSDMNEKKKELENLKRKEELEELKRKMEPEKLKEKEGVMEEVQLRPRPVVLSKEWAKRLTDYQFLSGKNEDLPKRQTRYSTRSRRNQRFSVNVPQITRRSSNTGYKCLRCDMVVHTGCLPETQRCEGHVHHEPPVLLPQAPSDPYPGYGILQLLRYPWWVESMRREEASRRLELLPEGTFLIRWSDRHQKLVLSLKVARAVKHMRVLRHEEGTSFYLSEVRYFRTIEALVNYYRQNSLSECFSDLFAKLSRPLYDTAVARYPYQGSGANYLSLEPLDRVIIISHDGERTGWWKGRIGNRVGYFPKEYVQVENNFDIV